MSDLPCTVTYPKANKQHDCYWCDEQIVRGEKYAKANGQWEGEWQDWKMHTDCFDVCQKVSAYDDPFCDQTHKRGKPCQECQ